MVEENQLDTDYPVTETKMPSIHPNAKLARFTFNLPAENRYFDDVTRTLRIRLERDAIFFKPSASTQPRDGMELSTRSRGGRSTDLSADGTCSAKVMRILANQGLSINQPFFILRDDEKGWISIEHYPGDDAPPKSIPHMRVWSLMGDPQVAAAKSKRVVAFDMAGWTKAYKTVLRACTVITEYEGSRKLGRPSTAVEQAKKIIASFTRLHGQIAQIAGQPPEMVVLSPARKIAKTVTRVASRERTKRRA